MKITKEYWSQFGFSFPNREVFILLKEHQPIVEVCAGGGMYNAMARALGIDIKSYDGGQLKTIKPFPGSEVHKMDAAEAVRVHEKTNTIFMCYPPLDQPSVVYALGEIRVGQKLIYTGEYKKCPFFNEVFSKFSTRLWKEDSYKECIALFEKTLT